MESWVFRTNLFSLFSYFPFSIFYLYSDQYRESACKSPMEEERVERKDGCVDEERSGHESSEGTEHTMGLGKRQRKASHRFEREEIELSKVTKPDKKKRRIVKGKENPKGRMAKASAKKSNIVYVTIPVGESKVLPSVALSHVDKASQLVLSEDQMTCRGCEVSLVWMVMVNLNDCISDT